MYARDSVVYIHKRFRFCFNENVWRFIAPLVPQRRCFSAIVYNNRLHIVGGRIRDDGPSLNRVDCFDPSKNKWTVGTPMAFDRNRPTLSEDKGFLYVYSTNSLERYDPTANSWMVSTEWNDDDPFVFTDSCLFSDPHCADVFEAISLQISAEHELNFDWSNR